MSSGFVRRLSREDIMAIQNLIELCLQSYMNPKEVVETLLVQAKIEPDFTQLVWKKLEEENQEFFKAYYLRLRLKEQITEFNRLLKEQAELSQLQSTFVASLPNSNGSHSKPVKSIAKKLCDTISELASALLSEDLASWPDLLPLLFQLFTSPDARLQEISLLVFAQLAHYIALALLHRHHMSASLLLLPASILFSVSPLPLTVTALRYHLKKIRDQKIIPRLRLSRAGHPPKLERFSHYVARQMGFKDRRIGPDICRLASEYISKYEGFEDDIYAYFENEPDADSLYVKLVEEFERCILSYFGFHWNHCDILMSQVLSSDISEPKKKLKNIVMAATRDQRFERVAKSLKVASVFNTLVEEMKAMGIAVNDDSQCTEVMAPVAHSDRSPILLLMGGAMGAGKSTVLKDILKEPFWAGASGNAVVIEADAFKELDVIYRELRSTGHHDTIRTAELVR
ncbi:hypothetical protein RYX36_037229 [Vicia faba]